MVINYLPEGHPTRGTRWASPRWGSPQRTPSASGTPCAAQAGVQRGPREWWTWTRALHHDSRKCKLNSPRESWQSVREISTTI
eukprot:1177913-Prorocentrum_minimum.AAC.3